MYDAMKEILYDDNVHSRFGNSIYTNVKWLKYSLKNFKMY